MSEFQVARAGAFDDIPIYALADGSRLKVWDGPEPPDPELVNLWLDPSHEILKRYDIDDGWTDAGIVGATGEVGPQGERGEKGDTGERGPGGEKGETGTRGETGPRGFRGQQGDAGIPGPKGEIGSKGDTGERGPKGDKGDAGEKGQRGPRGYSVLSGQRDPEPEDGRDNDFWINTQTALIFGPKTDGEWGQGASIRGPMGPRGLSGTPGQGVATGGIAGQLLSKIDAADYNTEWVDAPEGTGGGPVDWSDITFDDGRPEYEGEQLALWSDRELEEDSRAESDPITYYPSGISIMPVSAEADWQGNGDPAAVVTYNVGSVRWQYVTWRTTANPDVKYSTSRIWDESASAWGSFVNEVTTTQAMSIADTAVGSHVAEGNPHTQYLLRSHFLYSEDDFAESDSISEYDEGISIMPVSAAADWNELGENLVIVTERSGSVGGQSFVTSGGRRYQRSVTEGDWTGWALFLTLSSANNLYVRKDSVERPDDEHDAVADIWEYPSGLSSMRVTAGSVVSGGWPSPANDKLVITLDNFWNVPLGVQWLFDTVTDASSTRVHDGITWSSFSSGGGSSDAETLEGEDGDYYLDRTNHTGTQALGTITGHDKAAHDALDIDADTLDGHDTAYFAVAGAAPTVHAASHKGDGADPIANATTSVAGLESAADKTKLDGIESGATADQTAAEILTAVKTVDGTGSGLDADLLDGVNSTGFVQTADYEDSDVLAKVKNVDGTGSGLDADTVDGVEASAFATAVRTISTTAPLTGGGDLSANRTLAVSTASETAEGVSERATQVETDTGTDDVRYVSPLKLKTTTALDSRYYTETESDTLLAAKAPSARTISTTAPLTGGGDLSANRTLAVSQGTDTAQGVLELATDVETQTGSDTARAITPANLSARSATETRTGIAELATQAETDTGTDDARIVTPLKLATNPRIPSQGENDALVGTSGTASSTNKYVTDADSRNTNTRTPTDSSVTNAKVDAAAAIAESKLSLASDAAAATASRRTLGTGSTQAAAGDHTHAGLHRRLAVVSGSDVNNAATLNFADITGLTFAVTSGVHYKFQAYIDFVVNATTTGARFSMNGPALTRGSWRISLPPISGAAPYAPGFLQQVAFDTGTATASFTATSPNLCIIEGFFVCSGSGTAAVRFASEVATANFLTIKIGSSLEYWSV